MEVRFLLSCNDKYKWNKYENIYFRGQLEKSNSDLRFLRNQEFQKISNNFCSIVENENEILLITDRIRSFPLFYSVTEDSILLSDSVNVIRNNLKSYTYFKQAKIEFNNSGFCLGNKTLIKEIKHVEANSIVKIDKQDGSVEANQLNLFDKGSTAKYSYNKLFNIHNKIISEIIENNKGANFLVPLSGGFDSRQIIISLAINNCKNVKCFTYGKPNNPEVDISKQVAAYYGYEWHFIEFTSKLMKKYSNNSYFKEFVSESTDFTSIAHIQDFVALRELQENGVIDDSTILLPGHSEDFLAGSHLTKELLNLNFNVQEDFERLIQIIFNKHFSLRNKTEKESLLIKTSIKVWIQEKKLKDCVKVFEQFDWFERQVKFIVNSVRAYDFLKIEWFVPLWDKRLISFWNELPNLEKLSRKYYINYALNYKEYFSLDNKISIDHYKEAKIVKIAKINNALKWVIIFLRKILGRDDKLNLVKLMPLLYRIKYIFNQNCTINSLIVNKYLKSKNI